MREKIKISVNGKAYFIAEKTTIAQLLVQLELKGKRIAVEHNKKIIASAAHTKTLLNTDDCLEIIHAVGGG